MSIKGDALIHCERVEVVGKIKNLLILKFSPISFYPWREKNVKTLLGLNPGPLKLPATTFNTKPWILDQEADYSKIGKDQVGYSLILKPSKRAEDRSSQDGIRTNTPSEIRSWFVFS